MMKIGKGFFLGIMGALALASCQSGADEDHVMDAEEGSEAVTWKMTMTVSEAESRASVDENQVMNGNPLQVRWDKEDKVKMMIGTDAENVFPCEFMLQGESSIGSAVFEYEGDQVDSYYYYGLYPSFLDLDQEGRVHLSVPVDGTICQAEVDDSRHLGKYRAMYAAPVERDESSSLLTGVVFRHLTGLVIFKITNQTEQDRRIKSIRLSTADGSPIFYETASFKPVAQEAVEVTGSPSSSTLLNFLGNGLSLPSGEMHKAYLPVLPTDDFSHTPLVIRTVMENDEVLTTELPLSASTTLKKFGAGGYCIFNVKKTPSGIQVEVKMADWEDGGNLVIPFGLSSESKI